MMTKNFLLFDIDNSLIDRDSAFHRYLWDFIDRNSAVISDQERYSFFDEIIALDCHGKKERGLFCSELIEKFPRLPFTPELFWLDHQNLPNFVEQDALLISLLERLSEYFHLLIISNGSGDMQRRKLRKAGILHFFEHIFISGEIGSAKPDLTMFKMALAHCQDGDLVMIGDDFENDIEPAVKLRIKTIFINPRKEAVPVKPDKEIANIHELEEALRCLI